MTALKNTFAGLTQFLFFAVILFSLVAAVPQIFTDVHKFCDFKIAGKNVTIPDKLWSITTRDFNIFFSLCKTVQSSCKNQTSSCLILKQTNELVDFGTEFHPGQDDYTFVSSSHTTCRSNPAKNYTLFLSLQCSDSSKPKPRLMPFEEEDECTFEVMMASPNCRPKCTETINNAYLLDFRTMKTPLHIETDSKNFSLTFCGSNSGCPNDLTACLLDQHGITGLATIESQHFSYNINKNELTARGRYKKGRVVRDLQVLIKCKWETELDNARYKQVPSQGKHYKFEVESSYGCIKLPQRCAFVSIDNLNFNLTSLNKLGGWEVSGVPEGKILLNLCAPLTGVSGKCADQHSQVCHLNQNNYINKGSILSSLQAHDDVVVATFVSGSTCVENGNFSYDTTITFKCSQSEKGPVFREQNGCRTFLTWETPHACPVDVYISQNCYAHDRISHRNLQKIYTDVDKIYPLDERTKLVYNLCGPIHEECSGFTNVSFCLKTPGKDVVIGWESKELISETGRLRMVLQGSTCSNQRNRGEVTVHFVCSYETPPPPYQIRVLEDSCKFNVTIFTHLACVSQAPFNNCTFSTANVTYDLSKLTKKSDNYEIATHEGDFVFNLCGPVVSGSDVLCKGDTMVCWRNKTEVNIKHKYVSVGGVARPKLRNGSLIVEAMMGAYCRGLGYYKSVIHFQCSQQHFPPTFVFRNECVYDFEWKTPEACPRDKNCLIPGFKPDMALDLTNLQKKSVVVNIDNRTNEYALELCSDSYVQSSKGVRNIHSLKRHYFNETDNTYVVLDLGSNCDSTSTVSKVFFKFQCSLTDDFQQTSFENCVLNMTVGTHIMCQKVEPVPQPAVPLLPQPEEPLVPQPEEPLVPQTEEPLLPQPKEPQSQPVTEKVTPRIDNNCMVLNAQTGYEFHLNKLKSEQLIFNNTAFRVNVDGNLTSCVGVLCRNNSKMVGNTCPTPSFDYTNQKAILQYSTKTHCGENYFYELEIFLRCNQSKHGGTILKDDTCKSVIAYDLPEACLLLKQDILTAGTSKTVVVAAVVSSIVVLSGLVLLIYMHRRRCSYYMQLLPFGRDKTCIPIYTRDSTL